MIFFEIAIKAFVVLATAGLLTACLRRGSAASRHLVWTVAVAAVLALPILVVVTPDSAVGVGEDSTLGMFVAGMTAPARVSHALGASAAVETPTEQRDATAGPAPAAARVRGSVTGTTVEPEPLSSDPREAQVVATPLSNSPSERVSGSREAENVRGPKAVEPGVTQRSIDASTVALAVWLAGALLVLAALGAERLRLAMMAGAATRHTDGRIAEALQRLSAEACLTRTPTLRVGDAATMPMTWGALRAVILLPAECENWSTTRLETVLRHELAHVRRRDDVAQLAATVVAAIHWFDPLAWVAVHRLRIEREHACDDEVLRRGAQPSAYAEELLEIARGFTTARATTFAAQSMARRSQLKHRLRAVLQDSRRRGPVTRRQAVAATSIGLLLAAPLATVALAVVPASPATAELSTPPPAESNSGPIAAPAQEQVTSCWAPGANRRSNFTTDDERGTWSATWDSDQCHGEIRMRGELVFNDDFTEIVGVTQGGNFRIEIDEDGTERRLELYDADGGLRRTWLVDGRERDYDAAAAQWFSSVLVQVLRGTGIAAEERATSIYQRQGAEGIFREVGLMVSNSTRSRYLVALIGQDGLSDGDLNQTLAIVRDDISSTSNKARVLGAFGEHQRDKIRSGGVSENFWASVRSIDSNSTTSRLLNSLVEGEPQGSPLVTRVLETAGEEIDSNSTLAAFLTRLQQSYPDVLTGGAQSALFWTTVAGIDSNSTIRKFLLEVSTGAPVDSSVMPIIFETAQAKIHSDSTLAAFLTSMEERHPGIAESGPMTATFWATAEKINSDSTLRKFLLEVAAGKPDNSAVLDRVLDVGVAGLGSNSARRQFLVSFSEAHGGAASGRLEAQILEAAAGIGSRSNRERALNDLRDLGIGRD